MKNELKLSEKNLIDSRAYINELEGELNKEISEKEQLQNENHDYKLKEIEKHNEIDKLIREKNSLSNEIDEISKVNLDLSNQLEVTQRNLYESNREVDNLKINLKITDDKIQKVDNDINDQKILKSSIEETKKKEVLDLNKFIDDTQMKNDNTIAQRREEQESVLNEYEINKQDMKNKHNLMARDLDDHIAEIHKKKTE